MLTQNNWSERQTILKETTLAVTTVKSKEDEIQSEFSKNLADFYKLKRKAIRLRENNLKVLGISSTSKPLTKIKVEISQNEDDLSYYLSIKQFLFEFRNNPDILLQFIGTLTNSDDQYLAAKVLMHFFYEDVTDAILKSSAFSSFFKMTKHPDIVRSYSICITFIYRNWLKNGRPIPLDELIEYASIIISTGYRGIIEREG